MTTLFLLSAFAAPSLEGTWALEMRAVSASQVPVLGDVRSVTRTGVLVHLEPDGDGWVQHHRPCGSSIDGGAFVKTRIPDAYFEQVQPKTLRPEVDDDGRFVVDVQRFTGGWDPSTCDAVPTTTNDPCVRDWDDDGKPGITIEVKAPLIPWAEVYVAQKTHPFLEGHIVHDDLVEGAMTMLELDNRVLGASNRLFHGQPRTRSVNEASTFRMERLPDDARCSDVLEHLALER